MFNEQHLEITVFSGWALRLTKTCELVHETICDGALHFHWVQICEEEGEARLLYCLQGNSCYVLEAGKETRCVQLVNIRSDDIAAIAKRLDVIVIEAERLLSESCLVCGRRAEGGWHFGRKLPLCGAHHPQSLNERDEVGLEGLWRISVEWCAPCAQHKDARPHHH
jgi:hypothetical protein